MPKRRLLSQQRRLSGSVWSSYLPQSASFVQPAGGFWPQEKQQCRWGWSRTPSAPWAGGSCRGRRAACLVDQVELAVLLGRAVVLVGEPDDGQERAGAQKVLALLEQRRCRADGRPALGVDREVL